MKNLTDEQLEQLGKLAADQFATAMETWKLAMTCLPINSREYRAICTAGRQAERAYWRLFLLAERSDWTSERFDSVFWLRTTCNWR